MTFDPAFIGAAIAGMLEGVEESQRAVATARWLTRGAPYIVRALDPDGRFSSPRAYDVRNDSTRVCISCGSDTQPCCGH